MRPKWLTLPMVLTIHDEALAAFGGLGGVRDAGLLDSALAKPRNLFAYRSDASIYDLAAALCYGIVKNHPFVDGNKRTGLLAARGFLLLNGRVFEPSEVDEVNMMVGVAEGQLDEAALASWFAEHSSKRTRN